MLLELILRVEEEGPEAENVVAGWIGFVVFLGLILAVAFLGWSLTKQLRKADKAQQEGVFGPPNGSDDGGDSGTTDGSGGSDSRE